MEPGTVLITGAKGGLGEALVHEFRKKGWHVIATQIRSITASGFLLLQNCQFHFSNGGCTEG